MASVRRPLAGWRRWNEKASSHPACPLLSLGRGLPFVFSIASLNLQKPCFVLANGMLSRVSGVAD